MQGMQNAARSNNRGVGASVAYSGTSRAASEVVSGASAGDCAAFVGAFATTAATTFVDKQARIYRLAKLTRPPAPYFSDCLVWLFVLAAEIVRCLGGDVSVFAAPPPAADGSLARWACIEARRRFLLKGAFQPLVAISKMQTGQAPDAPLAGRADIDAASMAEFAREVSERAARALAKPGPKIRPDARLFETYVFLIGSARFYRTLDADVPVYNDCAHALHVLATASLLGKGSGYPEGYARSIAAECAQVKASDLRSIDAFIKAAKSGAAGVVDPAARAAAVAKRKPAPKPAALPVAPGPAVAECPACQECEVCPEVELDLSGGQDSLEDGLTQYFDALFDTFVDLWSRHVASTGHALPFALQSPAITEFFGWGWAVASCRLTQVLHRDADRSVEERLAALVDEALPPLAPGRPGEDAGRRRAAVELERERTGRVVVAKLVAARLGGFAASFPDPPSAGVFNEAGARSGFLPALARCADELKEMCKQQVQLNMRGRTAADMLAYLRSPPSNVRIPEAWAPYRPPGGALLTEELAALALHVSFLRKSLNIAVPHFPRQGQGKCEGYVAILGEDARELLAAARSDPAMVSSEAACRAAAAAVAQKRYKKGFTEEKALANLGGLAGGGAAGTAVNAGIAVNAALALVVVAMAFLAP